MDTDINNWIEETESILTELRQIDFGYPLGENVIRPPSPSLEPERVRSGLPPHIRHQLIKFYKCSDGLSWPDVRNGLFIESFDRLVTAGERGEPDELFVRGSTERRGIIVFGTDGGGGRFCIDQTTGRILHVAGGEVLEKRLEVDSGQVSGVADDFVGFLVRLQGDLRAFVEDDREHQFLV